MKDKRRKISISEEIIQRTEPEQNYQTRNFKIQARSLNITGTYTVVASAICCSADSGIVNRTGLQTLRSIRYRNARDTPLPAPAPTRGTRPAEPAAQPDSSWEGGEETKRSFKVWLRSGFFSGGGSGAIWGRSGLGGSARRLEERLRSRRRVFLRRSWKTGLALGLREGLAEMAHWVARSLNFCRVAISLSLSISLLLLGNYIAFSISSSFDGVFRLIAWWVEWEEVKGRNGGFVFAFYTGECGGAFLLLWLKCWTLLSDCRWIFIFYFLIKKRRKIVYGYFCPYLGLICNGQPQVRAIREAMASWGHCSCVNH